MTTPPESSEAYDKKYFISDSDAELARLVEQERALTRALGGLLPEQSDQVAFVEPLQRVLDAACGSGGWAIHLAQTYPHLQVMGFDIDANMISYATTQAIAGKLENASFQVMNALLPLDYPDNFFDLVNARFLSVIGQTAWPQVLQELFRVTRPGGFIRLTEAEDNSVTTSPAFERMEVIVLNAFRRGGFTFSATGRSTAIPPKLPFFLRNVGCQHIRHHASIVDWSVGTTAHASVAQDFKMFFRLLQPFLIAVGATAEEEIEQLHRDIEIELLADDFCAFWTFYTVLGQKPC
ncbi:MAG: methyltransferase domain-containing protein [Chloroflexi bacterium]|nr:MAG: methyltransferase domain-containing protein [Chloroflexota bacterium]